MVLRSLYAVALLLSCAPAIAETAYVTDMLRLGLHESQDTSDAPFANLTSGTELEILQRVPNFAEVRVPDGRQGWVKSAFLVKDKPAQLIVTETLAELEQVKRELAEAEATRDQSDQEVRRMVAESAAESEIARTAESDLTSLHEENREYMRRLETYRGSLPIPWVVGAVVVAALAGFLLGLWSLDAYIRRRHGGFRLY